MDDVALIELVTQIDRIDNLLFVLPETELIC